MTDPLKQLSDAGVAIWLDDLSRERLLTGNLANLIRDCHVVGETTNPTIFQKAISGSSYYDDQLRDLAIRDVDVNEALRAVTAHDVRDACDVFRAAYDASDGVDGRVSIEVSPYIANNTEATIAEARALWWLVDRPSRRWLRGSASTSRSSSRYSAMPRSSMPSRPASSAPGWPVTT
jgi:transaldolase